VNRQENKALTLKQLSSQLNPERAIQAVQRPTEGWLRAFRHALGLSLKSIAGRLKVSPQAIHQLEKSEAAGTISLGQLEAVAGAMGCRVAYAVVPRQGSLAELAGPPPAGPNQAGGT
jgi:predicted DNA-binding mobile mystery protein A